MLAHVIPPPIASSAVIRFANLEPYKHSRLGIYLAGYMTSAAQAGRFAGDLVTFVVAWYHSVVGILAALAIIFIAWTYGLNPLLPL